MIKWFNRWFARKCKEAWESEREQSAPECIPVAKLSSSRELSSNGLNFTVYPAQGGTIIELRSYDHKTDRHNNKLYVVRDDQELGKELDHIITLEALRKF